MVQQKVIPTQSKHIQDESIDIVSLCVFVCVCVYVCVCRQPRRKKFIVVNNDEKGVAELKTTLTLAAVVQSLEFA